MRLTGAAPPASFVPKRWTTRNTSPTAIALSRAFGGAGVSKKSQRLWALRSPPNAGFAPASWASAQPSLSSSGSRLFEMVSPSVSALRSLK